MKQPSPTALVTIGIPTYEAGMSLVSTIKSIRQQTAYDQIQQIIVVVDGNQVSDKVMKNIAEPKLRLVTRHDRRGQSARINDLCRLAKTSLLILTNDDVILEKNAVSELIRTYNSTRADLISTAAHPLPSQRIWESILAVGYQANHHLLSQLTDPSYLSCNGRLLALSQHLYSKVRIPEHLWNNDAYIFFRCQELSLGYAHQPAAQVFFQSPANWQEHLKQSQKFQLSLPENQAHFETNLQPYYEVNPKKLAVALCKVFLTTPLFTIGYVTVLVISRFLPKPPLPSRGYWQTDTSTKQLSDKGVL